MGLALLGAIMMAGTLSLTGIVHAQGELWYIVPQFLGFILFIIAGFAEANRTPFDLPEADAELSPATRPSTAECASARSCSPSTSRCS